MPGQAERHSEPEGPAERRPDHHEKTLWGRRYDGAMWKLFAPILVRRMVRKGRRAIASLETIDDAIDFVWSFDYMGWSISPYQVRSEIASLLRMANQIHPRYVLEIGTASGGTLFLFTGIANPDATLISVDLPDGKFGGKRPESMAQLFKSFGKEGQTIQLLRADSHDIGTLSKVKDLLAGNTLDLLFIDGDHSYEGVRRDFEMYSSIVRKGGLVAFHDICEGPTENVGGVPLFWREVKQKGNAVELIENPKQDGYGIGILVIQ